MKRYFPWLIALFLISGLSLSGAAPVPDLVHVDADLTSDHKDPKSGQAEIIDYKLKLLLTNHLKEPTGPLVVRITFHNRDLAKRTNGVEKTINLNASIQSRRTCEITSDPVTYTFTPEHVNPSKQSAAKPGPSGCPPAENVMQATPCRFCREIKS